MVLLPWVIPKPPAQSLITADLGDGSALRSTPSILGYLLTRDGFTSLQKSSVAPHSPWEHPHFLASPVCAVWPFLMSPSMPSSIYLSFPPVLTPADSQLNGLLVPRDVLSAPLSASPSGSPSCPTYGNLVHLGLSALAQISVP